MADGPDEKSRVTGVSFTGVAWYSPLSPSVTIRHLPEGKTEFTAKPQKTTFYLRDPGDAQEFLRLAEKNPYLATELTGRTGAKSVAMTMETRIKDAEKAGFKVQKAEQSRFAAIAAMPAFRDDPAIRTLAARASGKTVGEVVGEAARGLPRDRKIQEALK